MKKKLTMPKFKNENEERKFWAEINLADYFQKDDFTEVIFPNLKPSSRSISLRIPEYILLRLKEQANELHIPYQTLIKQHIGKGVLRANETLPIQNPDEKAALLRDKIKEVSKKEKSRSVFLNSPKSFSVWIDS